jgi:FixJ family two-component response regulator
LPVAVRAIQDGAVTWLEKPCTDDQLLAAVEAAKLRAAGIASTRRDRHQAMERWNKLTPRLKQIAPLVAEGKSNKLISRLLTQQDPANPIADRTIENHRARIFDLLDLPNSNALQAYMRDNDL